MAKYSVFVNTLEHAIMFLFNKSLIDFVDILSS